MHFGIVCIYLKDAIYMFLIPQLSWIASNFESFSSYPKYFDRPKELGKIIMVQYNANDVGLLIGFSTGSIIIAGFM